jgi:hypothetical protein
MVKQRGRRTSLLLPPNKSLSNAAFKHHKLSRFLGGNVLSLACTRIQTETSQVMCRRPLPLPTLGECVPHRDENAGLFLERIRCGDIRIWKRTSETTCLESSTRASLLFRILSTPTANVTAAMWPRLCHRTISLQRPACTCWRNGYRRPECVSERWRPATISISWQPFRETHRRCWLNLNGSWRCVSTVHLAVSLFQAS